MYCFSLHTAVRRFYMALTGFTKDLPHSLAYGIGTLFPPGLTPYSLLGLCCCCLQTSVCLLLFLTCWMTFWMDIGLDLPFWICLKVTGLLTQPVIVSSPAQLTALRCHGAELSWWGLCPTAGGVAVTSGSSASDSSRSPGDSQGPRTHEMWLPHCWQGSHWWSSISLAKVPFAYQPTESRKNGWWQ